MAPTTSINRRTRARRMLKAAAAGFDSLRWPVNDPADWDDAGAALERAALAYAKANGWTPPAKKVG